jgi:hypothetical protein
LEAASVLVPLLLSTAWRSAVGGITGTASASPPACVTPPNPLA